MEAKLKECDYVSVKIVNLEGIISRPEDLCREVDISQRTLKVKSLSN